ncbi:MAG: anaerobic ribonucleoside-triphosphate reductase activating protein [Clostridia bacterium]|nr:anaerobic ribonucleoside-triphosphate reductase activating protein [Clostridia bacterium]
MLLKGLQKLTLLDFPGKVACTVFTGGCNFRCPFCHNASLVTHMDDETISEEDFFSFLEKRLGILDGVCISGGEPTLQPDLYGFVKKIKDMGYAVKLDTNGYRPDVLKKLCNDGLVDYVAMDIKNSPEKYELTAGNCQVSFDTVKESIEYLKISGIPHEFRTTVVKDFHKPDDVAEIAGIIGENERYFIQPFRDGETVIERGLSGFGNDEIKELLAAARKFAPKTEVRGIDL